eukprot:766355-Hanusia_phi.AAC.3
MALYPKPFITINWDKVPSGKEDISVMSEDVSRSVRRSMQQEVGTPFGGMLPVHPATSELDLSLRGLPEVPSTIQFLGGLEQLILDENEIEYIPEWFRSLSNMKELSMAGNRLQEANLGLQFCSQVTKLCIANNGLRCLPPSISCCISLSHFDCSSNHLEDLPLNFQNLVQLKHLKLVNNKFSSIPGCLSSLEELKMLDMSGNALENHLPDWLEQRQGLELVITIERKDLNKRHPMLRSMASRVSAGFWAHIFKKSRSVASVDRSITSCWDEDMQKSDDIEMTSLRCSFEQSRLLQEEKRTSHVCDESLDRSPVEQVSVISIHPSSGSLDLSCLGLDCLPDPISKISGLRRLIVDQNLLSTLPFFLSEMSSLQELSCVDNRLEAFPECLQFLSNLHTLSLAHNLIRHAPQWIDRLQSLKSLDMQGNQLTDLPLSFRDLTKISRLNLAGQVIPSDFKCA